MYIHTVTKFTLATRSLTRLALQLQLVPGPATRALWNVGIRAAGPGRLGGHWPWGCPGRTRAAPAGLSKLCVCVSHAERLRSCIETSQCAFPPRPPRPPSPYIRIRNSWWPRLAPRLFIIDRHANEDAFRASGLKTILVVTTHDEDRNFLATLYKFTLALGACHGHLSFFSATRA